MSVYVGTSGFSYTDWVGPFYPPGLDKSDWLNYYAQQFNTCELNFSYYRIPNAITLERMAAKVPEHFLFSVKAFQGITHEREHPRPLVDEFVAALQPLQDQGKFGCVLLQFPYSFHANEENRTYLARLREDFGELPVVVEFRSQDWIDERTFEALRRLNFGFCSVDEPRLKGLMPPVACATGPVAYVRFHGRNAQKWWNHQYAWERYSYSYSDAELMEWVPKIRALDAEAPLTLVYMNNHWQGQSTTSAQQLKLLMGGEDG